MKMIKLFVAMACMVSPVFAQQWDQPVRGSWVAKKDGTVLVDQTRVADIVVSADAQPSVQQAAKFLAQDIEKITGRKPQIVSKPGEAPFNIYLATVGEASISKGIDIASLSGKWEAYRIKTTEDGIWLVGSNFRGTAFAVYTLSERLGIDPLYHWTGYTPVKHETLAVKSIDYFADEPTFKYRGLFHDDEDTLPKQVDSKGRPVVGGPERQIGLLRGIDKTIFPISGGTIEPVWYERYFETALRLRMNQVAPFTRVLRPFDVQKMACDWGLFYTSHHYDILLSNPWGYDRFNLAQERGITGEYDWASNAEGMQQFWRAGVEENKTLDCIWPVGLRSTRDTGYVFPKGTTQQEKNKVFSDVINGQIELVSELLPERKEPLYHFTLYHEMMDSFQSGTLDLPEAVMLVWNDTGDGIMRALPTEAGKWKHGVYYHLAFAGKIRMTKQMHHTITPDRIEKQFRDIVNSGATEYLLLNVSELRQHVMNTRFIAEICWDATTAFEQPDAAGRYVDWWCREYFDHAAKADAVKTYENYFSILHASDQLWQGAMGLTDALEKLKKSTAPVELIGKDQKAVKELRARSSRYEDALKTARRAEAAMTDEQALFFYDNAMYGMLIDYRPTQAAVLAWEAVESGSEAPLLTAMEKLELLEQETLKAEFSPFENWYRETWIRRRPRFYNIHYSYHKLRSCLEE